MCSCHGASFGPGQPICSYRRCRSPRPQPPPQPYKPRPRRELDFDCSGDLGRTPGSHGRGPALPPGSPALGYGSHAAHTCGRRGGTRIPTSPGFNRNTGKPDRKHRVTAFAVALYHAGGDASARGPDNDAGHPAFASPPAPRRRRNGPAHGPFPLPAGRNCTPGSRRGARNGAMAAARMR